MPKMGGIEFPRELRTDTELHATTVVVLTTSDEERDKVKAYAWTWRLHPEAPHGGGVRGAHGTLNKYWSVNELP